MFLATTSPKARTWRNYLVTGITFFFFLPLLQDRRSLVGDGPAKDTFLLFSDVLHSGAGGGCLFNITEDS